jgi:hypothetical protein
LKFTSVFALLSILVLGCVAAPARADITVMNPSFETKNTLNLSCGACGSYNLGPIPDWMITDGVAGSWQPGPASYNLPLENGSTVAYSNGGMISQTLAATLTADTTYTLSVDVGHRLDGPNNGFATNYTIALYAGDMLLVSLPPGTSNGSITAGTFADETISFTSGDSVTPGENLRIVLSSTGAQTAFDDVKLTASTVPEPTSLALIAGALGVMFLALRRR